MKAELEYNQRAAEYNVEILKNQIENLNNEVQLMRRQNEKQKQTIDVIRATNERLNHDLDHFKKLSLRSAKKPGERSSLPPAAPFKPRPDLSEEQEVQVSLLDARQLLAKEREIAGLQLEIEERQRRGDELERQLQALRDSKAQPESETVKKLRFDNQILMNKLSEYKKAEKGAKDIVSDYEQMKMKYFSVLTENSEQKTQIQELIQGRLDSDIALKQLREEKERMVDELYAARQDLKRRFEELSKRNAQLEHLQEELAAAQRKAQEIAKREREVQQLQGDVETFLRFFTQVDKHLRTLVKFLREFIARCQDPKMIEHNQKQIKAIEGLLEDVRRAVANRDFSGEASRLVESLFLLSAESLKDVQTSAIFSDKERAGAQSAG